MRQKRATRKNRRLGSIPQRAPLAKPAMMPGSPWFSKYTQARTKAPVKGITPIKPATEGNRLAAKVARRIIATLSEILIKSCIESSDTARAPTHQPGSSSNFSTEVLSPFFMDSRIPGIDAR